MKSPILLTGQRERVMALGMSKESTEASIFVLKRVLANTYVLLVKTQSYHWHVEGAHFNSFHLMFEQQYNQLSKAIDEIAERLRALDSDALGTMHDYLRLSQLKEDLEPMSHNDLDLCESLANDHYTLVSDMRESMEKVEHFDDEATIDLLVERLREHDKIYWMLISTIR